MSGRHLQRDRPIMAFAVGDESYGVLRCWEGVATQLKKRGVPFTFALVDRDGALSQAMIANGVDTVFAPGASVPGIGQRGIGKIFGMARRVASQARLIRFLRREIDRRGVRALLVTSPLEVIFVGIAAKLAGISAYWLMPNGVSSDYPLDANRRIYRFVFRWLNVVPLANSAYTDATLGGGSFRRQVVHLGIDPVRFDPQVQTEPVHRAALGLSSQSVVIGVFARMVANKGQLVLVEALARLGERGRDVHLLLCGGPENDFQREIRKRAADLGIASRIHLAGEIDTDIAAHYRLCDVVANTRLDPEPFGLSVIEAMLMARPVLVHKAGGPGETVIDGVTGWHMTNGDAEAYATGLNRMLDDRMRWPTMGQAARAHALANFTDDRMADRLLVAIK